MIPKRVISACIISIVFILPCSISAPLPGSAEEDKPYINETVTTLKTSNQSVTIFQDTTLPILETSSVINYASNATTEEKGAAPEFEGPEVVEGGKAENEDSIEPKDSTVNEDVNDPPVPEGVEDINPEKQDSTKKEVEDAKGNLNSDLKEKITPSKVRVEEAPDSNFLTFLVVATLLVVCIYIIQHNKKRILGLVFEGKSGRTVRYRRLSQHDDREDIIY